MLLKTLSGLGALGAGASLSRAADSANYKALVCVFLFGGNDGNNTIVPMDAARYQQYASVRGNLALTQAELQATTVQGADGKPYAFHPSLTQYASLFTQKRLAVMANTGPLVQPLTAAQYKANQGSVPSNLFSHADQQIEWQTALPQGYAASGWAGRVADQISVMNSPSTFPTVLSVAGNTIFGAGQQTKLGTVLPGKQQGLSGFNPNPASQARLTAFQQLLTLDSGAALVQQAQGVVNEGISESNQLNSALASAPALSVIFPTTPIGAQLQQIAQIMQVRGPLAMNRQIFFASLGSFDTHSGQLPTQERLLQQLGAAGQAFQNQVDEWSLSDSVTLFTESDFSRTFVPNSNGGTDHAWGSHHIVVGGAVKGGQIYGSLPSLELGGPDDVGQGRWIPSTPIDQYAATLAQWIGVAPASLSAVFPNLKNFPAGTLGFLG
jgi:uncharacterized protein (DUF1501 family)